jgi:XTP/dITP diphosphohydrolase
VVCDLSVVDRCFGRIPVVTRLLIATTNRGKAREIAEILSSASVELATLADYPPILPPDENSTTFAGNARTKALYYAAKSGALTVADDSGLEIDALGGRPGVESARFGGIGAPYPDKFRLIHAALGTKPEASRVARFVCALALAKDASIVFEARGVVSGEIASEPRGTGGFGYDPIFFYPPFGCTFAEAGERKAAISHRGQAFKALRAFLESDGRRWPSASR